MDITGALTGALAGLAASAINTAVGSGALVAIPLLVWQHIDPRDAVIALSVGLLPGTISGAWAYRSELRTIGRAAWWYAVASAGGGALGAALLVRMPGEVFSGMVPWFILTATVLMALQPRISRAFGGRPRRLPGWLMVALFVLLGVYGALLGAGQGLISLALLAVVGHHLQEANGIKNLTNAATNVVAATLLVATAEIPWGLVAGIAVGALIGGWAGGRFARRLPDRVLRTAVIVVGLGTAVWALVSW